MATYTPPASVNLAASMEKELQLERVWALKRNTLTLKLTHA